MAQAHGLPISPELLEERILAAWEMLTGDMFLRSFSSAGIDALGEIHRDRAEPRIAHALLEIAFLLRAEDDRRGRQLLGRNVIGRPFAECDHRLQQMSLRLACNRLIHATSASFKEVPITSDGVVVTRSPEAGERKTRMPELTLQGEDRSGTWAVELDLIAFLNAAARVTREILQTSRNE